MGKQKLPEGWIVDSEGDAVGPERGFALRTYPESLDVTVCAMNDNADCWENRDVPASAILAVIRNADLDPVYELAKRLTEVAVANGSSSVTWDEINKLSKLIESLEEP